MMMSFSLKQLSFDFVDVFADGFSPGISSLYPLWDLFPFPFLK
jgi:hypothetical protein